MTLFYDTIASLPNLSSFDATLPCTPESLRQKVRDIKPADCIVDAVLLGHDIAIRQRIFSREHISSAPLVCTEEQLAATIFVYEDVLGNTAISHHQNSENNSDTLWELYYDYIDALGKGAKCPFLHALCRFEVSLKNMLAIKRTKRQTQKQEFIPGAANLFMNTVIIDQIVDEWAAEENPVNGILALERARFQWLRQYAEQFTFSCDEIGAYAMQLLICHRVNELLHPQRDTGERQDAS